MLSLRSGCKGLITQQSWLPTTKHESGVLYDKNFLWKRLQYDTSSTAYKSFNRKVEECGGNTYEKSQGAFISIVTAKSGGNVITEVRNS